MSARTAENELEFLKTAPFEKWWFKVKEPSESFTKLFNSLIDKHLFHIKLIRFMPGSGLLSVGQVTEIDEEGMWFLSHLFSNWQEMYEQAIPPWDRKQTEQGEPEQKRVCVDCGKGIFNNLFQCDDCHQWVCGGCWLTHQGQHMRKQDNMCAECNTGIFLGEGITCSTCWKQFHAGCYHAFHAKVHRQETKHQPAIYHCDNCGKPVVKNENTSSDPRWTCPDCKKHLCPACVMRHTHQTAYRERPYSGFNPNNFRIHVDNINLDELLKNMRDFSWQTTEDVARKAREEAERLAKEEAERKARVREQAQRIYEKQQRDQEEFYKNLFGNMGHFSFKNNRNGTYTHTWDFGHWESDDDHQNTRCDPGSAPHTLEAAFNHLGLSTRATVQEVKRAFRRKAKEAHPDTGGSDAAFKELNEAYQKALAEAQRNER